MKVQKRRLLVLAMVFVMAMVMVVPANVAFAEVDAVTITILHTNDMHGRIKEGTYDGMGMAKLATKINEIREEKENVLLLDAGDAFHGQVIASIVEGESVLKVMNLMGYDVMVPGNHDFNYGYERLLELRDLAEFEFVAANITKEGVAILKPYVIKEVEGVEIGIFGLGTPETKYKSHPKNTEGLVFENPIETAKEIVAELQDQVDVIILLSHLGLDKDSEYTSEMVAGNVEGIDLIVDGHSHTRLENGQMVKDSLIVQTGDYNKNLGIVEIEIKEGEILSKNAKLFTKEEAENIEEDVEILNLVKEIEDAINEITSESVGNTNFILDGERSQVRSGQTNLGNLITQAMRVATNADCVLTNGGGIRASIDVGEITMGEVIQVLPFGNYVVVKDISGSDILEALEHGTSAYPETKGAFPHVAGIKFEINMNNEIGQRIENVMMNGEPLQLEKMYRLATNDFVAAGGDEYTMVEDDGIVGEFEQLDEIVANHIKLYGVNDAIVDNRIQVRERIIQVHRYRVEKGDVLWKIAKRYQMTYQKVAEYNQLKNPDLIFPGQELMIPME